MNYFKRYITNHFTIQDFRKVKEEFSKKNIDSTLVESMKTHWHTINDKDEISPQVDFDAILSKVHHRINLVEDDQKRNSSSRIRSWAIVGKIAAIIVLPIMVTSLWFAFFNENPEENMKFIVSAGKGQQSQVILSDGTEVWLNSESKLEYATSFGRKNRFLKLKGEGYFKVAKNKKLPFVVNFRELKVTALGTEFNVDISGSNSIVTLVEGLVKINTKSDSTVLHPGQQLIENEGNIKILDVETELYTSWHQGVLIFKNELLKNITHQLEKKHDVHFVFKDDTLKNFRYRGQLKLDYSILKTLEILKLSTGLTYEIKGRNIELKTNRQY